MFGGRIATAMAEKEDGLLAWIFCLLFAASLVISGVGVYSIQAYLCNQIGLSISMFGVAASILACGVLASRALLTETTRG